MNIVIVNFAYDEALGNPEELLSRYHSLTEWSEALREAGASSVTVVQRFCADASFSRDGVEYRFYDNRFLRRARLPLRSGPCERLVQEAGADIVHVNGLDAPLETSRLRRALPSDVALVVQDHASGDPGEPRSLAHVARRRVRRQLMKTVDGFLFTTMAQAGAWRTAGLIDAGQPIYEVPEASTRMTPIDSALARRETGIDGNPAVLWVGRLNTNKDPLTVLEGFERSAGRLPAASLSMVFSEGDLLHAVRERVAVSETLSGRVRLIGPVPRERITSFYSAADLFVGGSHHEGSGYALMEACACGLTPVVTAIPAFRAITADGAIGRLWPTGDAAALANAIVEMAAIDREQGRRRVLAHFQRVLSWPAVAHAAMRAYHDAVARRRLKTA